MSNSKQILSSHCQRSLSDRSYEKRKAGAVEIEGMIKALLAEEKRSTRNSALEGKKKNKI